MSDLINTIASLFETKYGVTNFETREPEHVRGWVDGKYTIEAFPEPSGAIRLSYPIEDHRRSEYEEVLSTIRMCSKRVPPELAGRLRVVDDSWVVYANYTFDPDDETPEAAVETFVTWVRGNARYWE